MLQNSVDRDVCIVSAFGNFLAKAIKILLHGGTKFSILINIIFRVLIFYY